MLAAHVADGVFRRCLWAGNPNQIAIDRPNAIANNTTRGFLLEALGDHGELLHLRNASSLIIAGAKNWVVDGDAPVDGFARPPQTEG